MAKMIQRPIYCSACKEVHDLNLAEEPFALIENRQKDIEMRLCSKGREIIRPGDQIIFTNNIESKK